MHLLWTEWCRVLISVRAVGSWSPDLEFNHKPSEYERRQAPSLSGSVVPSCEVWTQFGLTGGWRKLHDEELHNLYSSPSTGCDKLTSFLYEYIHNIYIYIYNYDYRAKEDEMERACGTNRVKRITNLLTYFVVLVRERTIPTERPPLVGEVTANFCG
jgi:hypothetical protein